MKVPGIVNLLGLASLALALLLAGCGTAPPTAQIVEVPVHTSCVKDAPVAPVYEFDKLPLDAPAGAKVRCSRKARRARPRNSVASTAANCCCACSAAAADGAATAPVSVEGFVQAASPSPIRASIRPQRRKRREDSGDMAMPARRARSGRKGSLRLE